MNQGRLLLIPPEHPEALQPLLDGLSLQFALQQLATRRSTLLYLPTLESEAFRRLQKYPGDLSKNNHRTLVLLPRILAYILRCRPAYICLAAEAFYVRDPFTMEALHPPQDTGLTFGPTDLVEVLVKFTRVSFAQLKTQHFPMNHAWIRQLPDAVTINDADRLELGMKVARGFEMLTYDTRSQAVDAVSDILKLLHAVRNSLDRLPSDQEIQSWGKVEDSDSWLSIDYTDFEHELDQESLDAPLNRKRAGQDRAQNELREMVARFKSFVDEDDSSQSDLRSSGDSDDLASITQENVMDELEATALEKTTDSIEFNEARFMTIMKGWSSGPSKICQEMLSAKTTQRGLDIASDSRVDAHDSDEQLEKLSKAMESELLGLGALQNTGSKNPRAIPFAEAFRLDESRLDTAQQENQEHGGEEEDSTDLNLATNMLESFKSQAGLAGPGGNLMGLLGIRLPRDDDGSNGARATPNVANISVDEADEH